MILFAFGHSEWPVIAALLTFVVVLANWVFDGLGFNQLVSLLCSLGCAVLVLAALFVPMWIAEQWEKRGRWTPPKPPSN